MMQTLLYAVKYQMITLLGTDCWNHAMFCVQKGRIYGRESVFNSLYEVPEFSIPSRYLPYVSLTSYLVPRARDTGATTRTGA